MMLEKDYWKKTKKKSSKEKKNESIPRVI